MRAIHRMARSATVVPNLPLKCLFKHESCVQTPKIDAY
jgi:hypothetical protein